MLERYAVIISEGAPDPMFPQVEGDWVRYADAQATIAGLRTRNDQQRETIARLRAQVIDAAIFQQHLQEQIASLREQLAEATEPGVPNE